MKNFKFLLDEHVNVFNELHTIFPEINDMCNYGVETIHRGGKIIFCGNGGSAADSQHLAAEFTGRFTKDRKPLASIALTTDTSALTCISNDYSFDEVFSRQLYALGKKEDLFIGISTSGNSKNIIKAVNACKGMNIKSACLLGKDGGLLKNLSDLSIIIPSDSTARIQEAHIFIGHYFCGYIEQKLNLV